MQQRKSVLGRPSGTDGSDFSYRMVVDSRYTKVAQGKSRLNVLIIAQALVQAIGVLCTFFLTSKEEGLNSLGVSSIVIGFFSLFIGELGRRRSQGSFLRVYMVLSSISTLISIVCIFSNNILLQVIQDQIDWEAKKFELAEAGRVLLGVVVQLFSISTTISLIQNMSPPKRAS